MLPVIIPNSPIHFSLQGALESRGSLLAISDGCPTTLLNPVPLNLGGKPHGYLSSKWNNTLREKYNWAVSKSLSLSEEDTELPLQPDEAYSIRFQTGSTLYFCWKSHSSYYWRDLVKSLLDISSEDIFEAFVENAPPTEIAYLLSPILLACEGYSVGSL